MFVSVFLFFSQSLCKFCVLYSSSSFSLFPHQPHQPPFHVIPEVTLLFPLPSSTPFMPFGFFILLGYVEMFHILSFSSVT